VSLILLKKFNLDSLDGERELLLSSFVGDSEGIFFADCRIIFCISLVGSISIITFDATPNTDPDPNFNPLLLSLKLSLLLFILVGVKYKDPAGVFVPKNSGLTFGGVSLKYDPFFVGIDREDSGRGLEKLTLGLGLDGGRERGWEDGWGKRGKLDSEEVGEVVGERESLDFNSLVDFVVREVWENLGEREDFKMLGVSFLVADNRY
jgi:hypothetical protein